MNPISKNYNYNLNKALPSSYDDSLSYLEEVELIKHQTNELIDATNQLMLVAGLNSIDHVVSSPNIAQIREDNNTFEYSLDGTNWTEVQSDTDSMLEGSLNVKKDYGAIGDAVIDSNYNLISGTNNYLAFKNALADAITNGKNLFIPAGTYYISSTDLLNIISDKELRLTIYGEEQKTVLVSDTGIFNLSSINTPPSFSDYTQRIREVTFSNIIMKGIPVNNIKQGTAVRLYGFGYINFNNVEFWNFAKGLDAEDGSEMIMHNGVIAGNGIGLTLQKTDLDMANCSFYDTKIFNNDTDDIVITAAREINFYSCVISNNNGGTKLMSKTISGNIVACEIVNFVSCDIENSDHGVNSRGIEITGCHTTNFNNCIFAVPVQNKVVVDYAQAIVNFNQCIIAFPFMNAIAIKQQTARLNFYGCETGSFNILTSGYAWRNCNLFDNTRLLNINSDMEKGVPYPFAISNQYTIDKANFVTGVSSIKFEGATPNPKYIELDVKGCIVEYIDVIWKSDDANVSNCVHIFYEDGTEQMAFTSNNEYVVEQFSNGFHRTLVNMNDGRYNTNKIQRITLSIGDTSSNWWIDSVRIIGQGFKRDKMYINSAPVMGIWKKGDVVYQLNPSAGVPMGWTCTADGEPGTWCSNGSYTN